MSASFYPNPTPHFFKAYTPSKQQHGNLLTMSSSVISIITHAVVLAIFCGLGAVYIYFAILARDIWEYFRNANMPTSANWAFFVYFMFCFSAAMCFLKVLCYPLQVSSVAKSRDDKKSGGCSAFLKLAIFAILLVFHVVATVHMWNWWHYFDQRHLSTFARDCEILACWMVAAMGLAAALSLGLLGYLVLNAIPHRRNRAHTEREDTAQ